MFKIGDDVKIIGTSQEGKIIKIKDDKKCLILVNNKKIQIDIDMLTLNTNIDNNKKDNNNISINIQNFDNMQKFIPEIMIRHQVLEEALFNLEQFINDAIMNNEKTIRIIHGKSGGILRKAVHEFLKSNKNIKSFRLGNYFEGSYGVTIATLK